jgi:hypothetical protein
MAHGAMFVVKKDGYQVFTSTRELADIARRSYPQLKGGRITSILQLGNVELGRLYFQGEVLDLTFRVHVTKRGKTETFGPMSQADAHNKAVASMKGAKVVIVTRGGLLHQIFK